MGGVLAAAAVVVMCMGGLIVVATFVCPMLCILLLNTVFRLCGRRIAWAWYGAVAILSLLLGPDKEAALLFLLLGYYPMVKPWLEKLRFSWACKLLFFNAAIAAAYGLLLKVLGMDQLLQEYRELGLWMTVIMVVLGNVTFVLLDLLLRLRRR